VLIWLSPGLGDSELSVEYIEELKILYEVAMVGSAKELEILDEVSNRLQRFVHRRERQIRQENLCKVAALDNS